MNITIYLIGKYYEPMIKKNENKNALAKKEI